MCKLTDSSNKTIIYEGDENLKSKELCCTFAGHRSIVGRIDDIVYNCILDLVVNKNVSCFYVGNNGDFDKLCAQIVRRIKREFKEKNIKLYLVVPKMSTTISNNREYYEEMYDEVIIPSESDAAHYKAMITIRNKWMVENSDYIVTYIKTEYGGAYNTYKYAQKQDIVIIDLVNN